jgi:hypothetical protein
MKSASIGPPVVTAAVDAPVEAPLVVAPPAPLAPSTSGSAAQP